MYPLQHILISAPLGTALGLATRSLPAALLCFFSGFLVDIDHFLEYAIYYGFRNLNPKKVYWHCARMAAMEEEGGVKRIFLILHSGEIALLLWLGYALSSNIYLLALACGYSGHLIADASYNAFKPQAYFMSMRIKNGFQTARLLRKR